MSTADKAWASTPTAVQGHLDMLIAHLFLKLFFVDGTIKISQLRPCWCSGRLMELSSLKSSSLIHSESFSPTSSWGKVSRNPLRETNLEVLEAPERNASAKQRSAAVPAAKHSAVLLQKQINETDWTKVFDSLLPKPDGPIRFTLCLVFTGAVPRPSYLCTSVKSHKQKLMICAVNI